MSSGVAVQNASLDSLVNFAECGIHAGFNTGFRLITGRCCVGITGTDTALHESAHGRLVGLVLKAIALSDLDAFLRRFVIGHRAGILIDSPQR